MPGTALSEGEADNGRRGGAERDQIKGMGILVLTEFSEIWAIYI